MGPFSLLFAPGTIGGMELKNRIVMPSMGNRLGFGEGYATDQMVDYYVARARGGVGFIISQVVNVSRDSRIPGRPSIDDDKFIPKLRVLAGAVHRHGAKIALQLARPGAALTHEKGLVRPRFLAPSLLPFQGHSQAVLEMSVADVSSVVEDYADAARRTREAGFDAVEFHACHGDACMLWSFLSPLANRRSDAYGGSVERRARILCDVVARTKQKAGRDFPVIVRINGWDGLEGGIVIEDAMRTAALVEEAGADAISVSQGVHGWTDWLIMPLHLHALGSMVPLASAMKKAVKIPVIAAGRIDPELGESVLKEGKADFISMARPLLADPELPNKVREGRSSEIRACIWCNNCLLTAGPLAAWRRSCTVNPALLREREFDLKPAPVPKKVMVIGGGIAGMEAARVLAERGHHVSLFERSDRLGGQLAIAAQQESKEHFQGFIDYLSRGMNKAGVKAHLGQEATVETVKKENPDIVVIAAGAIPSIPPVPGANGANVVQANDVILGTAKVGDEVVVIGGRSIGMETAVMLTKQGKRVSLVTRRHLGRDMEATLYLALASELRQARVPVYEDSPVSEIKPGGVYFYHNGYATFLKADTVVLAVGVTPQNELVDQLKRALPDIQVYIIGDCMEPRNAMAATSEAAEVARQI
ncbi:MAG: NAD(P)/FAD-dependent oxidoreductase [Dehalococcoidia bacterium]|nr:NAD(P)/FAD-dependent oxidoreductase [Dehalococcoidia bacterium]